MSSPWWNVLTTSIGAIAALGGAALTQWLISRREARLDRERHQRGQDEKRADHVREVLLDMAAYAHHGLAVIERLADPQRSEHVPERPELVHRELLTARARVYASRPLEQVWRQLEHAEDVLATMGAEGDLPVDGFFATRYLPASDRISLALRLSGETVMWLVADALNPRRPVEPASPGPARVASVVLEAVDGILNYDDEDRDASLANVQIAFRLVAPSKIPIGLRQSAPEESEHPPSSTPAS